MSEPCPICKSPVKHFERWPSGKSGNSYDCPNCGEYFASDSALAMLDQLSCERKAMLSHAVWSRQKTNGLFEIKSTHVRSTDPIQLPGPAEQLDNLIVYWGREQGRQLSANIEKPWGELRAKLGAVTPGDVDYIAEEAIERRLIQGSSADGRVAGNLTFKGWEEFRRIERGQSVSRHAFMAMPFGEPALEKFVDEVFRPAVLATGFTLKRLDDEPSAGVIDNRMRVEIRKAKFLIADLTHQNHGAYWEAGYAEGLGKAVIYTCERAAFKKTHFDTNHCTTVVWERDEPGKAAEDLKATIRNTFPFDARMPKESGE